MKLLSSDARNTTALAISSGLPSLPSGTFPDLLDRRSQLLITTPRYEDVRSFVHKLLRRRQANAAIATSNECSFSFKLTHVFLLSCH
jgi:hypothetical protein